MLRRVPCVKDHDAQKRDHIRESVESRIKKAAEFGNVTRLSGNIAVKHVEQVRDYQNDTCPKEFPKTEQDTAADVYRYADRSQDVRMHAGGRQNPHHRVDDAHCSPSYLGTKHFI
jgi:hypothetical protein